MGEERLVTEVPSSLKQLARLVVRGFYTIEDALIVDMLVRNPCEYVCQRIFSLNILLEYYEVKVKQSHYRPRQALRAPGG
jgi:hypothetical protein